MEKTVDLFRDAIKRGSLGYIITRLDYNILAEEYGVTSHEVREACEVLENEGLLTNIGSGKYAIELDPNNKTSPENLQALSEIADGIVEIGRMQRYGVKTTVHHWTQAFCINRRNYE